MKKQGTTGRLDTGWHRVVCDVSLHFFTLTYAVAFAGQLVSKIKIIVLFLTAKF